MDAMYQSLKPIVWIIEVVGLSRMMANVTRYATAFCVKNDGSLITCAHIFSGLSASSVRARRLDMDDFEPASQVFMRQEWDLCLLRVEGVNDCPVATLASDGSLNEGDRLLCVANPHHCVGTYGLGNARYPCVNEVQDYSRSSCCVNYKSSSMNETPRHRVLGDVWNSQYFRMCEAIGKKVDYRETLNALIPIIQCGFLCGGEGCVGAPVSNTQGEVVGILASHDMDDQIAFHVTLIKDFLQRSGMQ